MKYSAAFILMLVLSGLSSFSQNSFSVNGKLADGTDYDYMYLEHILTSEVVDTAEVKDRKFVFKRDLAQAEYFRIFGNPQQYILIIPAPGENLSLTFDDFELSSPDIKGSAHTDIFYKQIEMSQAIDEELEELQAKFKEKRRDQIRELIKQNPTSLASLVFIDELDIDTDFESYKILAEGLKDIEDNEMVDDLLSKVKSAGALAIGSEAPEIDLPTPQGENVKLSDLRGNYVLIDFWAAWCRPCRMENPNLVNAYNKYHKKGFDIYSVSLDAEKDSWTAAIEADDMAAWTHVSDLMYWDSEAAELYGVSAIPFNVLIDKKGKIIAKNLRGEALEEKLSEIFD